MNQRTAAPSWAAEGGAAGNPRNLAAERPRNFDDASRSRQRHVACESPWAQVSPYGPVEIRTQKAQGFAREHSLEAHEFLLRGKGRNDEEKKPD
jgi:hypothetical protein